ncbi:MAG: hypothetical protein EON58_02525 [Alphaproteobacteria bacterium]|nr:MAG: hypothetical protein EON58_02525 [Alphaproteobacteria bacterium]
MVVPIDGTTGDRFLAGTNCSSSTRLLALYDHPACEKTLWIGGKKCEASIVICNMNLGKNLDRDLCAVFMHEINHGLMKFGHGGRFKSGTKRFDDFVAGLPCCMCLLEHPDGFETDCNLNCRWFGNVRKDWS